MSGQPSKVAVRETGTILDRIVAQTLSDLRESPPDIDRVQTQLQDAPATVDVLASLQAPGVRIIAEVKRRSPSAGAIGAIANPAALAAQYDDAGAAAISVLTEPHHFGGSLADLEAVRARVQCPVLRKDFIVDEVQILQARAAGASLVLLIAAVLPELRLRQLRELAESLGMHALVEAHTAEEVDAALASGGRIVGVNNRNLNTFEVSLEVCERLRSKLGSAEVAVAESGIESPHDIRRLTQAGYQAFLIGSALVRSKTPGEALWDLIGANEPNNENENKNHNKNGSN